MTTKTARTPGPWFVAMSDNATPHILTKDLGFTHHCDRDEVLAALVCYMPAEIMQSFNSAANAAFIVRAANSHDTLVEALTLVRDMARCPVNGQERIADCQQCGCSLGLVIPAALAKARQP